MRDTHGMRARGAEIVLAPAMALALLVTACAPSPGTPSAPVAEATPDWRREIRISADEALGVARAFTGQPLAGARAELMEPGLLNTAYLVDGPPWNIYVDAFAGRVLIAGRGDVSTGPGPHIGEAEAIGRATAFLLEHLIPTPAGAPEAELVDHGSVQTWEVTWQGRSGPAFAPDTRRLDHEPVSGTVTGLFDLRLPYQPAPAPTVTAAEASAAAKVVAGIPDGVVESSALWIWFDGTGSQVLVWRVQLSAPPDVAYGGGAMVDVDAITGDAVLTGQG